MRALAVVAMVATAFLAAAVHAEQCGSQAGGAVCPNCLCCSQFGWCGSTSDYCGAGCQSQCSAAGCGGGGPTPPSGSGGSGVASIVSRSLFDQMLLHRNGCGVPGQQLLHLRRLRRRRQRLPGASPPRAATPTPTSARSPRSLRRRPTRPPGGWATAPDGPYAWGYCFKEENGGAAGPDYCQQSAQWPCAAGKKYYGRGPIQLSYNFNYGPAGQAIGADLLGDPDLVASDATVSFDTAFWFWMTPQSPKPSCHAVATGQWTPSADDQAAGRVPGYGVITNIINGGLECGHGEDDRVADRIGFYKRYCDILGVSYDANLDCYSQRPFGS
ncbi:hypothetical protein OsJ_11278 [Oryza sativa Japonica Group]|uniref:chitinase n=1 Tax=Oryza sativa subsp. japonica TaxID=39947 RepID=A3AJ48_ORYSJ|nr:hypothetical protein OsJ_11278 [Oryza sativa Japonica Group]